MDIEHKIQMTYGIPILLFAMILIALDCAKVVNVEKFGYAFFGAIISHFLNYYFRKSPPTVK
jgi:hypothetical protein